MSGNINNARASKGKGMGKSAARAMEANERLMKDVLKDGIDENEMRFGQVEKIIGHGQFMVHLADGRTVTSTIRALFASKRGTPISLGTIVLIHLPNWEKDALTKNLKPVSFIEGILDNDTHVPVLKHRGELPEWMFSRSSGTSGTTEEASFEFVSAEAERVLRAEEEREEEEEEEESSSNSAAASRRTATRSRDVKIVRARAAKASGEGGPVNIDDI